MPLISKEQAGYFCKRQCK